MEFNSLVCHDTECTEEHLSVLCAGCDSPFHATGAQMCLGKPLVTGSGTKYTFCTSCDFMRPEGHAIHRVLRKLRGRMFYEIVK